MLGSIFIEARCRRDALQSVSVPDVGNFQVVGDGSSSQPAVQQGAWVVTALQESTISSPRGSTVSIRALPQVPRLGHHTRPIRLEYGTPAMNFEVMNRADVPFVMVSSPPPASVRSGSGTLPPFACIPTAQMCSGLLLGDLVLAVNDSFCFRAYPPAVYKLVS